MSTLQNSTFDTLRKRDRLQKIARIARYATVLLLLVLFLATHFPANAISYQFSAYDKVAHCLAYTAIAFSVLTSLDLSLGVLRPQHYFAVWLMGTLYGAFDEVTQIPVGRHCDVLDWISDILGIVIGLTLFRLLRPLLYRLVA